MDQRMMAMAEQAVKNMNSAKRWIWVTFQKPGFHKYPAAENAPELADVSYLGQRHRHLFKFKVYLEIFHNDRDVEFHQALNFCESLYQEKSLEIDYKSVEMLANDLYQHLVFRYPGRDMKIEVSEDGECGCIIEYAQ